LMQMLARAPSRCRGTGEGRGPVDPRGHVLDEPVIAFVYLVLVGSLIAFSAYAWLLKNVRVSVVSTYAFVNPVIAVALGTVFLKRSDRLVDHRRRRGDRRRRRADRDRARAEAAGGRRGVRAAQSCCVARATLSSMRSLNLRHIKLRSGEEYRDEIELELEPFELGGERYLPCRTRCPRARDHEGEHRHGVGARFHGAAARACYRCLGDAVLEVPIAAREYQANNPTAWMSCARRTSRTTTST